MTMRGAFLVLMLGMLLAAAPVARACNVPVFRFALERWESDNYVMVIAHDVPLTPAQQQSVDKLAALSSENGGKANLTVQVLDLVATPDDPAGEHLPLTGATLPAAFLFYPAGFGTPTLVWQTPLVAENLQDLAGSPVRDEFVAQVTKGCTAAWLLLESGDRAADDRAEQLLRESLTAAEQDLALPPGVVHPSGAVTGDESAPKDNGYFDPENQLDSGIPLRIAFDVIRLSASEPREAVLRGMLLHTAPGLMEKRSQPMAFPLFGRGRILQPLVGEEIQTSNIAAIARYLCGPCSCQVKRQNPGVDMLLEMDWETKLAGVSAIQDRELPPLAGTAALTEEAPASQPAAGAPPQPVLDGGHPVLRVGMWLAAAVLVLVFSATMWMLRKSR